MQALQERKRKKYHHQARLCQRQSKQITHFRADSKTKERAFEMLEKVNKQDFRLFTLVNRFLSLTLEIRRF